MLLHVKIPSNRKFFYSFGFFFLVSEPFAVPDFSDFFLVDPEEPANDFLEEVLAGFFVAAVLDFLVRAAFLVFSTFTLITFVYNSSR